MKPFSVYYSGGSAGCFFTLTLALASQKTHSISSTNSIQEIINKSWKFDDVSNWDNYQIQYDYQYRVPDNSYNDIINNKQYYPMSNGKLPIIKYDQPPHLINDNTNSILIYTDVHTHFALMEMKHRAYFSDNGYWVDYKNPGNIFDEDLLEYPSPAETYNDRLSRVKHSLSFPYKQMRVLKRFNELFFNDVDYKFLLQDVIKTKFKCVTDVLELEHNQEVIDHVEHWVSLHPDNIKEMFYK
jgi:hypothetical protein